jgi:integrase
MVGLSVRGAHAVSRPTVGATLQSLAQPACLDRSGKGGDDLVFSAREGGVLRVSHWRPRVFNPARDSLKGFPKVTPHDLRHTAASLAVSAGGNVLALARMLGHEDPSVTLRVYADLFDSDLDALADVLTKARAAALKQPAGASTGSQYRQ